MLKIGLTGGIGSGKTAVSNLFNKLGIKIIDTDVISRDLINNDPSVIKEITDTFSENILDTNATIDRKKLAQIVFNKKEKKQQLENILHPRIRHEVDNQLLDIGQQSPGQQYVIIVIPLLLETGFADFIDRILVVMSDEKTRIERVKQRDNRNVDEICSIIKNQASDKQRRKSADDIIENNNDFKQLELQIGQLHHFYTQLAKAIK